MAEMTEAERKILYDHDVAIINRQFDAKIKHLQDEYAALEAKHVAEIKRRSDAIQLRADQEINSITERDMRFLDDAKEKMELNCLKVVEWKDKEIASEVRQLTAHTQRQRKE